MDIKQYLREALTRPEEGDTVEYFDLKARISGNILTNAQLNIPSPCYHYDVDITKFYEEYKKLKSGADYHLTFNTLMMRVLAEGLKAAPRLNAHCKFKRTSGTGQLIVKKHIDVAMPIFFDDGRTFPVKIRGIENDSIKEIALKIEDVMDRLKNHTDFDGVLFDVVAQRMVGYALQGKVLTTLSHMVTGFFGKNKSTTIGSLFEKKVVDPKSLKMNEVNEATVCLTNYGPLYDGLHGSVSYTPILYPQVFLMAVGNIRDTEYVFKNEKGEAEFGMKKLLPITLMFDHRIGGFGDVMPFIKRLDEIFETPEVIREW